MDDHCGMSISAESPSDETLNRGPLALHLRRQYEFPFGINIVQFSISIFNLPFLLDLQVSDGKTFQVKVRFDTEVELTYFRNGGILNYMVRRML